MSMNTCPPELHSYICQLACINGDTVRNLSRVSKYFREIARPYLYYSVVVSGLDKIAILATKLETTPAHLRHIHHLFIADQTPGKERDVKSISSSESVNILRILSFAAPTVETLFFVSTCPAISTSAIARLFRIPLPHLHDLTVSGFYPFLSTRTMPSLERLHLHGNRNPHGLLQMGGLDEACPSLTHLRVSGLSMATSFVLELQEAFSHDQTSPFSSKLPPQIQHVVVQPGPTSPASGKSAASREQLMVDQLHGIQPPKEIKFSVLERCEIGAFYQSLGHDWLERLDGADGCWAY